VEEATNRSIFTPRRMAVAGGGGEGKKVGGGVVCGDDGVTF
jgi:hypothetical protein